MTDPRLYDHDYFVWLEAGEPDEILSASELRLKLSKIIQQYPNDLPTDVKALGNENQQVQLLADSHCELSVGLNRFFQWFAVRLEK